VADTIVFIFHCGMVRKNIKSQERVKPVWRGHICDKENIALQDRWHLKNLKFM